MQIGRKIYYEKSTGNVILDTGEKNGDVVESTIESDFEAYKVLQDRVKDSVGVIQLEYNYNAENFMLYPYHVDISKETIDKDSIIFDTANPFSAMQEAQVKATNVTEQRLTEIETAIAALMGGAN